MPQYLSRYSLATLYLSHIAPPVFHNNLSQDLKARYPSSISVEGRQASTNEDGMREEGLTFLFRN